MQHVFPLRSFRVGFNVTILLPSLFRILVLVPFLQRIHISSYMPGYSPHSTSPRVVPFLPRLPSFHSTPGTHDVPLSHRGYVVFILHSLCTRPLHLRLPVPCPRFNLLSSECLPFLQVSLGTCLTPGTHRLQSATRFSPCSLAVVLSSREIQSSSYASRYDFTPLSSECLTSPWKPQCTRSHQEIRPMYLWLQACSQLASSVYRFQSLFPVLVMRPYVPFTCLWLA